MFSPEISNENKGSRGWGWNCLDCLPSMHVTWGLSCSTTVFTAGQATLGRLRHNDISDFPSSQDYTHNEILCQTKEKQRTESQLKRSSCFPTFWTHYKSQVTFYSCFGFGAEDSNQGFTHAKYSCYPWTTHTPSLAPPPFFKDDLGWSGWSPQSSGLKCPCFSLTRAPGACYCTWHAPTFT